MKLVPQVVLGAVAVFVLLVLIAIIWIYTGSYNIAALTGHSSLVTTALNKTMVQSVRSHARDVAVPVELNLQDRALAQRAVGEYESMCVVCHGAPGRDPDRWTQAMYPPPPDLIHAVREHGWSNSEVFWIIKYGVKDTGMAAFGASHEDEELWALTGLVRQLPELTPTEYRAMVEQSRSGEGAAHTH